MPASIQCACNLSDDFRWHCQWATLGAEAKIDRKVAFSVTPPEFIGIINYLERIVGHPAEAVPRPDLGLLTIRLRFRQNAKLFELQVRAETGGLNVMVDEPQLVRLLDYHKSALQGYALDIYEGRVPIPEGYSEGYPEPRWARWD